MLASLEAARGTVDAYGVTSAGFAGGERVVPSVVFRQGIGDNLPSVAVASTQAYREG